MKKKIIALVAKETDSLKNVLAKEKHTAVESEFITGTFRIECIMRRSLEDNYSTVGMLDAANDAFNRYDSLLNKYYKKLAASLKPADRPLLLQAQKSWLAFRDNEMKLYNAMSADGGTAASLNSAGVCLALLKIRVNQLYGYYEELGER